MAARKLKKLRISEVSAVDVGAGRGVRIILTKRADGSPRAIELPNKETPMTPILKHRDVIAVAKNFCETGYISAEIEKRDVYAAMTKGAEKSREPNETSEQAFARYVTATDEGRMLFAFHKAAPGSDATPRPVFKSSAEILAWEAREERLKAGVPAEGFRDEPDPDFEAQLPKAVRSVAMGLVGTGPGKFKDITTAVRFMRSSARYASLFDAGGRYREAIGDMLASR